MRVTTSPPANSAAPRTTRHCRCRGAPVAAPKFVLDPSVRVAAVHRFAKDLSAELYARAQLSAVTDPLTTRSSKAVAGIIANRTFGSFVWSNNVEVVQQQRDFYDRLTYDGYDLTTALARPTKFGDSGWSMTPRLAIGQLWATNDRSSRLKTEVMAPVTYKLSKHVDAVFTPRVDWQMHPRWPGGRRDTTTYLAAGLKCELGAGVTAAVTIGYETRKSTVAQLDYSGWKLAPQLNLRREF